MEPRMADFARAIEKYTQIKYAICCAVQRKERKKSQRYEKNNVERRQNSNGFNKKFKFIEKMAPYVRSHQFYFYW